MRWRDRFYGSCTEYFFEDDEDDSVEQHETARGSETRPWSFIFTSLKGVNRLGNAVVSTRHSTTSNKVHENGTCQPFCIQKITFSY